METKRRGVILSSRARDIVDRIFFCAFLWKAGGRYEVASFSKGGPSVSRCRGHMKLVVDVAVAVANKARKRRDAQIVGLGGRDGAPAS